VIFFWVSVIVLLIVALGLIILPLLRNNDTSFLPNEADATAVFYKSQLKELSDDLSASKLLPEEFDAAKLELDRELLRLATSQPSPNSGASTSNWINMTVIVAVLLVAVVTYVGIGSPGFQNVPLDVRTAASDQIDVDDAVLKIKAHLASNPEDIQGWRVIAPVYMRQQNYPDAVLAFRNIVRLGGANADALTDLAEAVMLLNGGDASGEPLELLSQAASKDPAHIRSHFYLAGEATRTEQYESAISLWSQLIDSSVGTEEWLSTAQAGLNFAQEHLGVEATVFELKGPTSDDLEAASELSAEDRLQMIEQMVAGLAERLSSEGGSPQEWAQLLNAQMVQNDEPAAKMALRQARAVLIAEPAALEVFENLVSEHIATLERLND